MKIVYGMYLFWILLCAFSINEINAEFTTQHKERMIGIIIASMVLLFGSLTLMVFVRNRIPLIFLSMLALANALVPNIMDMNRVKANVEVLDKLHEELVKKGKPYPKGIEKDRLPDDVMCYYQYNSDESFGLVFILSSDAWVKEQSDDEWHWIGFHPDSYDPKNVNRKSKN